MAKSRSKKTPESSTALIESPIGNDMAKRVSQPGGFNDWMVATFNVGPEEICSEPEVNQHSMLSIAPYWRAISILCSLPARVAVNLKRRGKNGRHKLARDDNRYFLAKKKPNSGLKARTWKKTMCLHMHIAPGGGFSEIIRDPDTHEPLAIVPLDPNRMAWGVLENKRTRTQQMVYLYQDDYRKKPRPIDVNDVMHFKGLSYDAIMGIDSCDVHKQEFGLILARRQYAAKYFIGNAHLRGILMCPIGMNPNQFANMMNTIREHMKEQSKDPMKVVPFFEGVKYEKTQDDPEKSQLTESMKMSPAVASQLTGVPDFFLGAEVRGSYNAIEQILDSFYITTVDDIFDEFESEMDDKLLTEDELKAERLFFQFNRKKLQAMNVVKFRDMIRKDFSTGLLSWEEARGEMEETHDLSGGRFFLPANIVGANPNQVGNSGAPQPVKKPGQDKNKADKKSGSMANLADTTISRLCDRIGRAACKAASNVGKFEKWFGGLRNDETDIVDENLKPLYSVAIDFGYIDGPPEFDLLGIYLERLKADSLNAKASTDHPFERVVAAECDEIKTHVRQQFPRLMTGAN